MRCLLRRGITAAMPDTLKITLAQLNPAVGDVAGNAASVLAARKAAGDSDLVVFPELHLIGYPPEDLILKPALIERAAAELQVLAQASAAAGPAMLVGSAFVLDGALHNGVALLDQGKVAAVRLKHELPNYGTFDEMRAFHAGPLPEPVIVRGTMIGVPIGEDIWRHDVCRHLADFGAEMFVAINGSPYETDKDALRIEGVAKRRAVDTGLPLAYLNRVGGQDELVFDGASFVVNGDGTLAVQMRDWEEQVAETRWTRTAKGWRCDRGEVAALAVHPEDVYCAMVLALRDFVERGGFTGVVVGLDDGLGSGLCAAIAVDALGAGRVRGASHDGADAGRGIAAALGIGVTTIPVPSLDGGTGGFGDHHLPRLHAAGLLALADATGAMLVSTVDKSDLGTGGAALAGALAGGYAPLRDAYRTTVVALARWRNRHVARIGLGAEGAVVPDALIGPRPGSIAALDPILLGLVEHDKSVDQLAREGFDRAVVAGVEQALHHAERLRRQAPPGVKLTARNFGRDRRYPITHAFRSG